MSTTKPDAEARFCSGARSLQPHALLYGGEHRPDRAADLSGHRRASDRRNDRAAGTNNSLQGLVWVKQPRRKF